MRFGVRNWITVVSCLVLTAAPLLAGGEGESTAAESSETMEMATGGVDKNWGWATLADYERETGNRIASFSEAPMLAALVASGDLPPVEERLPDEPLVDEPFEQVGTYGGTLRLGMVSGIHLLSRDHLPGGLHPRARPGGRGDRPQHRQGIRVLAGQHHHDAVPARGHEVVGRRPLRRRRLPVLVRVGAVEQGADSGGPELAAGRPDRWSRWRRSTTTR